LEQLIFNNSCSSQYWSSGYSTGRHSN